MIWCDAIYRETPNLIAKRKEQGCLGVEMECAASIAVARFRNIPFVQFLFGADNLDCQEYDMRDLILYGRNAGNKYLSLAFECGIRLWITAHMPGLCLYDEISSKQKESNGFSVALFLYLYATKPATPLTKIYSVFAVFKLCRHWWRWSDSNWLPIRCERIALPGELHPRNYLSLHIKHEQTLLCRSDI